MAFRLMKCIVILSTGVCNYYPVKLFVQYGVHYSTGGKLEDLKAHRRYSGGPYDGILPFLDWMFLQQVRLLLCYVGKDEVAEFEPLRSCGRCVEACPVSSRLKVQ